MYSHEYTFGAIKGHVKEELWIFDTLKCHTIISIVDFDTFYTYSYVCVFNNIVCNVCGLVKGSI